MQVTLTWTSPLVQVFDGANNGNLAIDGDNRWLTGLECILELMTWLSWQIWFLYQLKVVSTILSMEGLFRWLSLGFRLLQRPQLIEGFKKPWSLLKSYDSNIEWFPHFQKSVFLLARGRAVFVFFKRYNSASRSWFSSLPAFIATSKWESFPH